MHRYIATLPDTFSRGSDVYAHVLSGPLSLALMRTRRCRVVVRAYLRLDWLNTTVIAPIFVDEKCGDGVCESPLVWCRRRVSRSYCRKQPNSCRMLPMRTE